MSDLIEMVSPEDKTGESSVFVTKGNVAQMKDKGWKVVKSEVKVNSKPKEQKDGESHRQ